MKFARQNCVHRANYDRHYRASDHLLRLVAVSLSGFRPPLSSSLVLERTGVRLTRGASGACLKTNWQGRTSGRKRVSVRDFTAVLMDTGPIVVVGSGCSGKLLWSRRVASNKVGFGFSNNRCALIRAYLWLIV